VNLAALAERYFRPKGIVSNGLACKSFWPFPDIKDAFAASIKVGGDYQRGLGKILGYVADHRKEDCMFVSGSKDLHVILEPVTFGRSGLTKQNAWARASKGEKNRIDRHNKFADRFTTGSPARAVTMARLPAFSSTYIPPAVSTAVSPGYPIDLLPATAGSAVTTMGSSGGTVTVGALPQTYGHDRSQIEALMRAGWLTDSTAQRLINGSSSHTNVSSAAATTMPFAVSSTNSAELSAPVFLSRAAVLPTSTETGYQRTTAFAPHPQTWRR